MYRSLALAGAGWLALAAGMATAQTTITGIDDIQDQIDEINETATDEIARGEDAWRYGNTEEREGFSGSASLAYSGKTGNNESQEFTLGTRLRYSSGPWLQTLGIAVDYAEDEDERTKEDTLIVYDANYLFNDRFYGFILGRAVIDGLADEDDEYERDGFIGVGPGYRVINKEDIAWRIQGGVGISYLRNGVGESDTEEGVIVGSRFFYRFSPNVFLTNDTDVLSSSDGALRASNELGLSLQATDVLSTRISYVTDYNELRDIQTDNKLSIALVYGF